MSMQNLYDNQSFFDAYIELRNQEVNANSLVEMPAFFSVLPSLKGKQILDLGCGFGDHCQGYRRLAAKKVIGIDISSKMIETAIKKNKDDGIEYFNMAMEDVDKLDMKFDIICSSLAFHYVEDFKNLMEKLYSILNDDGYLIFSQEHPIVTAYHEGNPPRWERDENGNKIASRLFDYGIEGQKLSNWFDTEIIIYHRRFSSIINALIETGFTIDKVLEPIPSIEVINKYPKYSDNYHRPDFLIIRAIKLSNNKGVINE